MNALVVGNGLMGTVAYKELVNRGDSVTIVSNLNRPLTRRFPMDRSFDILIDFSHPDGIESIVAFSRAEDLPAVIGTTGYSDKKFELVSDLGKVVPVLYSGNFSLGVILMERLVKETARVLGSDFNIEIIEKHHQNKIDAPSGTAKMLQKAANEHLNNNVIYGQANNIHKEKEIAVQSIRTGSIVGEHEIRFTGADEVLSIKHEALSKSIFAKGAIKASEWLIGQEIGLYSMEDVLFGD